MSTGRRVNYGVWRGGATGNKGCYACDLTDRGPSEGLVGLDADLPISPHISPYLPISPSRTRCGFSPHISPHISPYLEHASRSAGISPHISPHLPASPHISPCLEYELSEGGACWAARPVAKPGVETRRDGWPTGGRWELKPAPGAVCFLGPPVPKVGAGYFEATLTGHGRRSAPRVPIRHLSALRPHSRTGDNWRSAPLLLPRPPFCFSGQPDRDGRRPRRVQLRPRARRVDARRRLPRSRRCRPARRPARAPRAACPISAPRSAPRSHEIRLAHRPARAARPGAAAAAAEVPCHLLGTF